MTKLSDTQLTILSAAAQRPDGNLLPLPGSLRGGAAGKVVGALLSQGLPARRSSTARARPIRAPNTLWRNLEDGAACCSLSPRRPGGSRDRGRDAGTRERPVTRPTSAPCWRPSRRRRAKATPTPRRRLRPPGTATQRLAPRKTREGTKQAALIAMLKRPEGATIAEIVEATGWQPHYADVRIMPR